MLDVHGVSRMLGFSKHLLYVWVSTSPSYRRSPDGPEHHHHPATLHRRVGRAAATRSHSRRVRRDRVYRVARPRAHAGHHHAALPVADSAWQYRLQPSAPSVGLAVQCGGLLSSPRQTPAALLCSPPGALRHARCSDPPWTKGGGMAIARFSSMARGAPCPIPRPSRRRSASRRSSGRGAAFPWRGSWGCSMRAPVCS